MPEGDTIYRSARTLERALAGSVCTRFETALAHLASVHDDAPIAGRAIERVEPRGKWLLIHFSGDLILVTHMLMSGSWHLYKPGERWRLPRNRMRAVIRTADWEAVAFNVPIAEFHTARSLARHAAIPKLGLDVLGDAFTVESGVARLKAYAVKHPGAEVGVVLLNQTVLAGLGNVYKSEVAFAAGVNPFRAVSTLTPREMDAMVEAAGKWMRANVLPSSGRRRTTGSSQRDASLWVYRRQGQECRRCGTAILTRKQGTQARSTYWCPACQP